MVVKKNLLQASGVFRLVRVIRQRKGFFQTGSPISCHSLKHKSTHSAYLETCSWLQACGLLAGRLHITTFIFQNVREEPEIKRKLGRVPA